MLHNMCMHTMLLFMVTTLHCRTSLASVAYWHWVVAY